MEIELGSGQLIFQRFDQNYYYNLSHMKTLPGEIQLSLNIYYHCNRFLYFESSTSLYVLAYDSFRLYNSFSSYEFFKFIREKCTTKLNIDKGKNPFRVN